MSQYISENPQGSYQSSLEYSLQSNYYSRQTQRNPPIRESSLNRNNSVSSSMIFKPDINQQNLSTKLKRQSNRKNSVSFKENDPYAGNPRISGQINKPPRNLRDSSDFIPDYDLRNSYCNPLIVKREKMTRDSSRQKIFPQSQVCQNSLQNTKISQKPGDSFYQQQCEYLSQKMTKIESMVKENTFNLSEQKTKIQKLEEFWHNDASKSELNQRNARSLSVPTSVPPNFKQLSDIMSRIEETKNYQIRNSQKHSKMIEQFRSNILDFREELNKTVKKNDLNFEIQKLKDSLPGNFPNISFRKSSAQFSSTRSFLVKSQEAEAIEKIKKEISSIKNVIERLQENNMSLKADMVKITMRDKQFSEETQCSIAEMGKRLQSIHRQISPFNECRRGYKYEGSSLCFKVSQQLWSTFAQRQKVSSSSKMTHSSVVEYQQGQKIQIPTKSSIQISQKTYYIDKEGFLLDKDNYYLINDRNEQVRLSEKEIEALRRLRVLE